MSSTNHQRQGRAKRSTFVWLALVFLFLATSTLAISGWFQVKQEQSIARQLQETLDTTIRQWTDESAKHDAEHDLLIETTEQRSARIAELESELEAAQAEIDKQTQRARQSNDRLKYQTHRAQMGRGILGGVIHAVRKQHSSDETFPLEAIMQAIGESIETNSRNRDRKAVAYYHQQFGIACQTRNPTIAEHHLRQAIAVRDEQGDIDHEDSQEALVALARILEAQARMDESVQTLEEAATRGRRQPGRRNTELREALKHLAGTYIILERFEDAEAILREYLELIALRQDFNRLARVLQELGRYDEAEALLREHLKQWRDDPGLEDDDTFEAMVRLAWILRLKGRHAEADELESEFTGLAEFMKKIRRTFRIDTYGPYLTYMRRYDQAEFYCVDLLEYWMGLKEKGIRLNRYIEPIIELYHAWGKPHEAEKYRRMLTQPIPAPGDSAQQPSGNR